MAGRISLSQAVEDAHQQGQCPPNPILTGPPRGQVRKLGRGRDERGPGNPEGRPRLQEEDPCG